jgi:hypothetical protein
MAIIVFKVSRFNSKKLQVTLSEYLGKDGNVKAAAYLHLEDQFLSGLPQLHLTDSGEKFSTFERNPELADQKFIYNISLNSSLLEGIIKQVDNDVFKKPTKNEEGVSLLRKWQIQVVLKNDTSVGISGDPTKDFITYWVSDDDVEEIKLVSTKDPAFIHYNVGYKAMVKADVLAKALYKPLDQSEAKTLETVEETTEFLKSLSKAEKRGRNRKYTKEDQSESETTASKSLILEDDDHDDLGAE